MGLLQPHHCSTEGSLFPRVSFLTPYQPVLSLYSNSLCSWTLTLQVSVLLP